MGPLDIDRDYLLDLLRRLIAVPSPSGMTDAAIELVEAELAEIGVSGTRTRRGALRARLGGGAARRAVATHVDTLGAMVRAIKPCGRLALRPIGHWSSRAAEYSRATVIGDTVRLRGTILPLKASGHTFNEEVDHQPVSWDQIELRLDTEATDEAAMRALGVDVGDFVAIDPGLEVMPSGHIVSRHLDDKAGVAALIAAVRAISTAGATPEPGVDLVFTVTEEIGHGGSGVIGPEIEEMVAIDNGTVAPGQRSAETGVTIAMADTQGPFDYRLTRRLAGLCRDHGIPHQRDVFRFYRSDLAAAVEAGADVRTALVCFGVDASHGYERTHIGALEAVARLMTLYIRGAEAG